MSSQWCEPHWTDVRERVVAGTCNAVVTTLALQQAWMKRAIAEGRLKWDQTAVQKNAVLHRDAPLCCFMGKDALAAAIAEGSNAKPARMCLKCLIPEDVCYCLGRVQ